MATNLLKLAIVVAILAPSFALAQEPQIVKDLLDKGGKRVAKDELVAALSNATMSGSTSASTTFENNYKADGTVSGAAHVGSDLVGVFGKWSVNRDGMLCSQLRNTRGQAFGSCVPYFILDGAYYSAPEDEPTARLSRRTITK